MYSNNEKILNYKRGVVHVDGCPSPLLLFQFLSIIKLVDLVYGPFLLSFILV